MIDLVQITTEDGFDVPWPILVSRVGAAALARRLGVRLEHWDEGGLGAFDGFAVRLPSGRAVLVRDSHHLRQFKPAQRTTIAINDPPTKALVAEVQSALGLIDGEVTYRSTGSDYGWIDANGTRL